MRLSLFATALALLAACSAEKPRAPTNGVAATQLVRGNGPEPDSLDPQRARNVESGNVLRDLYEGLTTVGRDGGPAPGVATHWSVSADGLRWSFYLRPTARWSNGDPVEAIDFVAALRRLVDPKTASQYAQVADTIHNAKEIIAGKKSADSLGVSAPDAHTLLIRVDNPTPYLPGLLSHWAAMPVHRATLAAQGAAFVKPRINISNGAYQLTSWVQGAQIDLTQNPFYWNNVATRIAQVRWVSQSDEPAEYNRYRAGEIHVTYTVPRGQFDAIRREHAAELHLAPQLGTYFYGFNLDKEPFRSQQGLRRALSLVIDRQMLVTAVTRVGETPADSWVPPNTFGYTPPLQDYARQAMPQRIAEARRLYAAAGYSVSRPLRFELRYNTGEIHKRVAVAVADMWKRTLGLEVALVAVEFKVLQQDIDARKVDVFRLSWIGDYNDPYTFLQYFKSDFGINTAHFRNPRYDALLAAAAQAKTAAERREHFAAAERLLLVEQPLIPLFHYVNKHLVSPRVDGWYDNIMNVVYSRELRLRP